MTIHTISCGPGRASHYRQLRSVKFCFRNRGADRNLVTVAPSVLSLVHCGSAGNYGLEERTVRRMRCLATTLAVEIVRPTPSNAENETVVELRYMTASTNIERTISTDASMISKAASLSPHSRRSTALVIPPATAPNTLAGKTYTTRAKKRANPVLIGIIVSCLVSMLNGSQKGDQVVTLLILIVKYRVMRCLTTTLAVEIV
jgi:hypothetical protein